MPDAGASTIFLQGCLERMNSGDHDGRDELFRHAGGRLERLTRKMLRGFPGVQRWCDTGDVLQGALARLLRSLAEVRPASLRDFFGLSAAQIRRELIDLARHYQGPEGIGANHASAAGRPDDLPPAHDRSDQTWDPAGLASWGEFHEHIKELPEEEREVVDLLFYQELTQAEAAQLLSVSVRTLQRRWQSALVQLHELLGGRWPGL
jgi:RNA polymerase sigma factor (sigma-70 family)